MMKRGEGLGGRQGWRPRVLLAIQLLVTTSLLYLIFRNEEFRRNIGAMLEAAEPVWMASAVAGAFVVHVACWLRWHLCLSILGIAPSPGRTFRFYAIGQFASMVLLGQVGADAVRIGLLWRDGVPRAASVVSVLLDRISGFVALAFVTVVFSVLRFEWFRQDAVTVRLLVALWMYLGVLAVLLAGSFLP